MQGCGAVDGVGIDGYSARHATPAYRAQRHLIAIEPQPADEYQIGEVIARSCRIIGTSGSVTLSLNFTASYRIQREVGILITRA